MNITSEKVSKIVAQNYKTASVFTEYGIDFCCNGGIPLEDACERKNLDLEEVLRKIELALSEPDSIDFDTMELRELVDYIVGTHHAYINRAAPEISKYLDKVCNVHGSWHPDICKVKELFEESRSDLADHMRKEELNLFPFVKALGDSELKGQQLPKSFTDHIDTPIEMLRAEHEQEGDRFRKIASLTNNYSHPKGACQTFQVAYAMLQDFESDLHKHVHLENNILFPKAQNAYAKSLN